MSIIKIKNILKTNKSNPPLPKKLYIVQFQVKPAKKPFEA